MNTRGGINVGAILFALIGFVALIMSAFVYVSREDNDSAEVKRILGDAIVEMKKVEASGFAVGEAVDLLESDTNAKFTALTKRVYDLEQKPLPAPHEPPPAPVINFPSEVYVKTRRPIAVDVLSMPKRAPVTRASKDEVTRRRTAISNEKKRLKKVLK
jgi:hypothetical protein